MLEERLERTTADARKLSRDRKPTQLPTPARFLKVLIFENGALPCWSLAGATCERAGHAASRVTPRAWERASHRQRERGSGRSEVIW